MYGPNHGSPRAVSLSKHAMDFVVDYGPTSPQSFMQPDIPLRDPLDQEFVLNRKMAKQFYEIQLQQRMQENKQKLQEEIEMKKKVLEDKEVKAGKAV